MDINLVQKVRQQLEKANAGKQENQRVQLSGDDERRLKDMEDVLKKMEKSYDGLKNNRSNLEKIGIDFDELKRDIKSAIDRMMW